MNRKHFPVLDGIRGLAIIAVLLRHVAYVFAPHQPISRWLLPIPQFLGLKRYCEPVFPKLVKQDKDREVQLVAH